MLTNWLNRDQSTCHTENLKQTPFGSSQGHLFCMRKEDVPKYAFNHMHVDNSIFVF